MVRPGHFEQQKAAVCYLAWPAMAASDPNCLWWLPYTYVVGRPSRASDGENAVYLSEANNALNLVC